MASPHKISAYTSQPVQPCDNNNNMRDDDIIRSEGLEASHFKMLKIRSSSSIKRTNDNLLATLCRPTKRITSCNSLNNISEPLFKNIKHYTSKKLRSSSSTTTPPGSPPKRLSMLVTTDIYSASTTRTSSGFQSLPSTPLKNPGLSFDNTPSSEYSPVTPSDKLFLELSSSEDDEHDHVARQLFKTDSIVTDEELNIADLSLNTTHHIFKIPEIVHQILEIYDLQNSYIPHEQPPTRRIPLSYEHALLIHKDEGTASKVWQESRDFITNNNNIKGKHALFNCLTVNKLWYHLSREIMAKNCYFDDDTKWLKFASCMNKKLQRDELQTVAPESFVLHKLTNVKQRHFDLVTNLCNLNNLKWLELYICPKVLPNPKMFTSKLKKLVITGSKVLNDDFLIAMAPRMPNLEILDLRACELITDSGIYSIALNCPKLKLLNVGRHTRGELVSDASICSIVRNTQISTLGVAGCGITDRSIWELAIHRSHSLERLSLNKCWRLTNESLPKTIKFFKKLCVLEIRHCLRIDNVKPIVEYRRNQMSKKINVLIEGCETIEKLIAEEETHLDIEISKNILSDIREWCNSNSDDGE